MAIIEIIVTVIVKVALENIGAVIMASVGSATAITGALYAVKSYKISKKESEKSTTLNLAPYGNQIEDYYILLPLDGEKIFAIPFSVDVANGGNLSAHGVELGIDISDLLYRSSFFTRSIAGVGKARKMKHAVEFIKGTKRVQVYVECGDIGPDVKVPVSDHIFAQNESVIEHTSEVKAKDGVSLRVPWKVYFQYLI
jgi:hypothetical protein